MTGNLDFEQIFGSTPLKEVINKVGTFTLEAVVDEHVKRDHDKSHNTGNNYVLVQDGELEKWVNINYKKYGVPQDHLLKIMNMLLYKKSNEILQQRLLGFVK